MNKPVEKSPHVCPSCTCHVFSAEGRILPLNYLTDKKTQGISYVGMARVCMMYRLTLVENRPLARAFSHGRVSTRD